METSFFFEAGTEVLNIIYMNFSIEELSRTS
jgi:hypothetical protein